MKINTSPLSGEIVAKRMCFLAYEACGGPVGMGFLQARGDATEADVWQNIVNMGDYPGASLPRNGKLNADYVFGRMMKLRFSYDQDSVTVPDITPDRAYQRWSRKWEYPTYEALVEDAIKTLKS